MEIVRIGGMDYVRIANPRLASGWALLAKREFDPAVHTLWERQVTPITADDVTWDEPAPTVDVAEQSPIADGTGYVGPPTQPDEPIRAEPKPRRQRRPRG